jgi:Subtilase family
VRLLLLWSEFLQITQHQAWDVHCQGLLSPPHAGVAPAVTYGVYRVFGCAGVTSSDIIIAALEQALTDSMDVVNLSLGSFGGLLSQDLDAQAASNLVKQGIAVFAAAGNDGNQPFVVSSPSIGTDVVSVASIENSRIHTESGVLQWAPGGSTLTVTYGGTAIFANGVYKLAEAAIGLPASPPDDACTPPQVDRPSSPNAPEKAAALTGKRSPFQCGDCAPCVMRGACLRPCHDGHCVQRLAVGLPL